VFCGDWSYDVEPAGEANDLRGQTQVLHQPTPTTPVARRPVGARSEQARSKSVVEFMLALAIVNLALGYAAAMALVEPPLWSGWVQGWRDRWPLAASEVAVLQAAESPRAGEAVKDLSDVPVPTAVAVGLDDLPADWLAQLAAEGIVAQTFVEAVAHVLRLEVGRYREQLVAAEVRTRASADDRDAESLRRLIDELRYVNQDWLDKQMAAADMLAQRAGRLGDHEHAAAALEQVLLDQAAQIRTACGTLQSLDAASEAEIFRRVRIPTCLPFLFTAYT